MNLISQTIQVGKKYALYLPKKVMESLNIKEGDLLILEVKKNQIILKPLKKLEIKEFWSEISPEEVEEVGEEVSEAIT